MRDAKNRQLIALLTGYLFVCPLMAMAEPPTVGERLIALKLMEATVGGGADPEGWKKLGPAYDALVAEFPENAASLAARGSYRWENGETPRATEDWQAALRIEPGHLEASSGLADAALAAGEVAEAATMLRRALVANPTSAAAHFALANVLYLFRHDLHDPAHPDDASVLDDALGHFTDATRLAPANLEYARGLAETFYGLPAPDWNRARMAWEAVRDLSGEKDFAFVNLARVHLRLGQPDVSRVYLEQVHRPDYQRVKARLEAQLPAKSVPAP